MRQAARRHGILWILCACWFTVPLICAAPYPQELRAQTAEQEVVTAPIPVAGKGPVVVDVEMLSVESVPVFNLQQLLDIALDRNPAMDVSQLSVQASTARVKQARSFYLPHLDAQAGFHRYWMDLVSWANSFSQTFPANENIPTATVTLSQYVYDFGKTDGRYSSSRHLKKASEQGHLQTTDDVTLAARIAYYNVLKSRRFVEVQEESLAIYERHLEQARDFLAAGMRPQIDVTKADVAVSNGHRVLLKAQYAAQLSRVILENVLAGPPVQGPYKLAGVPDPEPRPVGIDGLVDEAMTRRPEITAMREQVLAATGQVKTAWGDYLPSIRAQAAFDWMDAEIAFYNHAYILGVGLDWNIFSGLRTREKVAETRAVRDRLEALLRQKELLVTREVNEAVIRVNENVGDIRTTTVVLKLARENLDLAEGRYKNGLGDYLEFSDAELTWRRAANDLIQAQYSYLQALAELDHALGRNSELEVTN